MNNPRVAMRPIIETEKAAESEMEQFQNGVLRPIVKMQNDHILYVYQRFLRKRKVPFQSMSKQQRLDWIGNSLSKDNRLRGIMLGMVMGHFTLSEMEFFHTHESEVRRRITNLLTERVRSQVKHFVDQV